MAFYGILLHQYESTEIRSTQSHFISHIITVIFACHFACLHLITLIPSIDPISYRLYGRCMYDLLYQLCHNCCFIAFALTVHCSQATSNSKTRPLLIDNKSKFVKNIQATLNYRCCSNYFHRPRPCA